MPEDFASPPILVVAIGMVVLVVPFAVALFWQHRMWQRAEREADRAQGMVAAIEGALDVCPDGYMGFLYLRPGTDAPQFRCSRRLAVLLDLHGGTQAQIKDVLAGFDGPSAHLLETAITGLRDLGEGFSLDLAHVYTARRIEARGIRATGAAGEPLADLVWMRDITDGAEEVEDLSTRLGDLRRRHALLEAALDGLPAPVWLRDDDLSLIYANAAYAEAVDADQSPDDMVRAGRELAPKAHLREARALAAAARASGSRRRGTFHMVMEGSRRLMEVVESPVGTGRAAEDGARPPSLFGDGTGRLTAGMAYDITAVEDLGHRLSRQKDAQGAVLEKLGTAIAIFDRTGALSYFNSAYAKLWRLDGDWLGTAPRYGDILEALRDRRRLPEVPDFPAFKEAETGFFGALVEPREEVLHLPQGETIRRVIAPYPAGGLMMTFEDVTDRLALESSYKTLTAVHRETVDNLREAVAVFGPGGTLRLFNPAFVSLWNFEAEALGEGPHLSAVIESLSPFFPPEHWPRVSSHLHRIAHADTARGLQTGRLDRLDGSTLEFSAVPLPDGGHLYSFEDISAIVREERKLREQASAIAAADRTKSAFIGSAARELTPPLMEIMETVGRIAAEQASAPLTRVAASASVLLSLTRDVVTLSALEAGSETLSLDEARVGDVLDTAAATFLTAAPTLTKRLTVTPPEEAGWMIGDAHLLERMLAHMMREVADTADTDAASLTLSAARGGDGDMVFTCRATVPPNHRTGVLDPDQAAGRLGLYLARRFCELHGGTLSAPDGETALLARIPTESGAAD